MSISPPATSATSQRPAFQRLLGRYDTELFLREYFGRSMLHVVGDLERFATLYSWDDLSRVLTEGFVSHPRARLVKQGTLIDPTAYTYELSGRRFLDSMLCHRQMAAGATLIIEHVDRTNPRLATFVDGLKRDLNAEVNVAVVATTAETQGLSMHWDPYECFSIQMDGAKAWDVVRPVRAHPLIATKVFPERRDVVETKPPISPPITWSGTIEEGHLLYLPRGWWHNVKPVRLPSLHLTVAIDLPTGSEFLAWCVHQAKKHDVVRRILPTWATSAERRAAAASVLEALLSELSANEIDTYFSNSVPPVYQEFSLPRASAPVAHQLKPDDFVRLRSAVRVPWLVEGEKVRFEWFGKKYEFNVLVQPAIEKLFSLDVFTVAELGQGVEPILIKAFLMTLYSDGVVVLAGGAARTD